MDPQERLGPHQRLEAILNSELPSTSKLLLAAISQHLIDKDHCWPSQRTLARLTSLHRATVIRTLAELQQAEIITANQATGKTCTYTVHWDKLKTYRTVQQPVAGSDTPTCRRERHLPVAESDTPCRTVRQPLSLPATQKEKKKPEKKEKTTEGGSAAPPPLPSLELEEEQEVAITPVAEMIASLKEQFGSSESVQDLRDLWHGGVRQRLQTIHPAATSTDLLRMVREAARTEFGGEVRIGAIFSKPDFLERLEDSVRSQIHEQEFWFIENADHIIREEMADTITDEQILRRLNRLQATPDPREEFEPEPLAYTATDVARCREILTERWTYQKTVAAAREAEIAAIEATLPPYQPAKITISRVPTSGPLAGPPRRSH